MRILCLSKRNKSYTQYMIHIMTDYDVYYVYQTIIPTTYKILCIMHIYSTLPCKTQTRCIMGVRLNVLPLKY